jgi:hypothetical protein
LRTSGEGAELPEVASSEWNASKGIGTVQNGIGRLQVLSLYLEWMNGDEKCP